MAEKNTDFMPLKINRNGIMYYKSIRDALPLHRCSS